MTENLFMWALILSPYDAIDPPTVVYVSHSYIVAVVCNDEPCNVVGMYHGGKLIYVEDGLSKEKEEEVIIHETVHYLQERSGKFGDNCFDRSKREVEAYMVSREYTKLQGRPPFPMGNRNACLSTGKE